MPLARLGGRSPASILLNRTYNILLYRTFNILLNMTCKINSIYKILIQYFDVSQLPLNIFQKISNFLNHVIAGL